MDDDGEEAIAGVRRGLVRKLGDDFERVARESGEIGSAERSNSGEANLRNGEEGIRGGKKKLVKGGRKIGAAVVAAASGIRRSPRLSKMR